MSEGTRHRPGRGDLWLIVFLLFWIAAVALRRAGGEGKSGSGAGLVSGVGAKPLQPWAFLTVNGGLLFTLLPLPLFYAFDGLTVIATPAATAGAAPSTAANAVDASSGFVARSVALVLSAPAALLCSRPMQWFANISMCFYMLHGQARTRAKESGAAARTHARVDLALPFVPPFSLPLRRGIRRP